MTATTRTVRFFPEARHSFVDLTDDLRRAIKDSGVTEGCAVVFCAHTTCALLINEWETGAMDDFRARLDALVPRDLYYAHDDLQRRTENLSEAHERRNGQAHRSHTPVSATSQAVAV